MIDNKKITKQSGRITKFTATWCGPCKILQPHLEEIQKLYDIEFVAVDADEHPDLLDKYRVTSLPTVILTVDDKAERIEGCSEEVIHRIKKIAKKFFTKEKNSNQILIPFDNDAAIQF